jgi:hypothetical protein
MEMVVSGLARLNIDLLLVGGSVCLTAKEKLLHAGIALVVQVGAGEGMKGGNGRGLDAAGGNRARGAGVLVFAGWWRAGGGSSALGGCREGGWGALVL